MLTQVLHWYPTSLVGIPTEKFSNMAPPTIVLVCHAFVLFGAFVLLAPWIRRRFVTPRFFHATARAGLFAMTVYLWHMLVLMAWLSLLHVAGVSTCPTRVEAGQIVPDGLEYWAYLVPVAAVFVLLVYCVARWLWPVEFVRLPWFDAPPGHALTSEWVAALGTVLLGAGLLVDRRCRLLRLPHGYVGRLRHHGLDGRRPARGPRRHRAAASAAARRATGRPDAVPSRQRLRERRRLVGWRRAHRRHRQRQRDPRRRAGAAASRGWRPRAPT